MSRSGPNSKNQVGFLAEMLDHREDLHENSDIQ
jgi:hypothetical protein